VLGIVKDTTGGYALGFVLLAFSALAALIADLVVLTGGGSYSQTEANMQSGG
jgi:hypothetical protein